MHELSIAEGIIEIVERTAKSNNVNRVKSVRIAVGELAGVDIDCLLQYKLFYIRRTIWIFNITILRGGISRARI